MTDSQRTLIAVLLDRSGSMESIKSDTEGGFNAFIDTSAASRARHGSRWRSSTPITRWSTPTVRSPTCHRLDLQPRGGTALYDALGRLITDVGAELAALPEDERPGTVVVVVLTDGHENSSHEWTHDAVSAAIRSARRASTPGSSSSSAPTWMPSQIGSALGFPADRSMT